MADKKEYLEVSKSALDGGELVGRLPKEIGKEGLKDLGYSTSPVKAIRAHCIMCSGDSPSEVRKCTGIGCPLWAFRMGTSPYYNKKKREQT